MRSQAIKQVNARRDTVHERRDMMQLRWRPSVAETTTMRENDRTKCRAKMTGACEGARRVGWERFREDPCETGRNSNEIAMDLTTTFPTYAFTVQATSPRAKSLKAQSSDVIVRGDQRGPYCEYLNRYDRYLETEASAQVQL